jgi:kynureninase
MSHTAAQTDSLLSWRAKFPILERTTYLVSHSLGAMPRGSRDELNRFADEWDRRGVRAWNEGWWEIPERAGNLLADILRAPHGSVSMHLNVTLAQSVFLSCFDWSGKRNRLVCSELDFPSLLYLYDGLRAYGAEVVRVPSDDGVTIDPERLAAEIDERTAVAAFSHVIFKSGAVIDVEPVVSRARECGAVTLLDAYQSVAVLDIDVGELGVDALTGGSVKWLCGGPGAGYLYVSPQRAPSLRPWITGWMAHPEPFAFDTGPMEPVSGAYRFMNGTPGVPSLYAAETGYRIVREIGGAAIRARSLSLTTRLLEGALERGWPVHTPRDEKRRAGTVTLGVERAQEVCQELLKREVILDQRPGAGLRLGAHFYNTEDDIDRAVSEIEDILRDLG